jgi:hypothetical protein
MDAALAVATGDAEARKQAWKTLDYAVSGTPEAARSGLLEPSARRGG